MTGPYGVFNTLEEGVGVRAFNRKQYNFRVILRRGALWLVWPTGEEESLTPVAGEVFRVGAAISPERLGFDRIVGGQAFRARLSGMDYYRFFTP